MTTIDVRAATVDDEPALWTMLFYASHSDHEENGSIDGVKANPKLAHYIEGWKRSSDLGFVAVEDGAIVGAAWSRLFPETDRSYGWVDAETPEIVIACGPDGRGKGIGTLLLRRLIDEARGKHPALCLTVRSNNPAARLYERFGFETVAQVTNRVGGVSSTMVLRLR